VFDETFRVVTLNNWTAPTSLRPISILVVLSSSIWLGGCNLEWAKPEVSLPPPERFRASKPKSAAPIPTATGFVPKFGSKELSGLVDEALENNLDIAAAVARMREADAQARISSAALYPAVTMNDTVTRLRVPGTRTSSTPPFSGTETTLYQLGLNASYEIDFWGKNDDASRAARLLANANRFDRDVIEISTVASVLNAYFQALSAQDRLRIARENVKIANQVFQAIKARLEVGIATALDYAQQETVLDQQRALIPPFEQTYLQTRNTLAVLLGRAPETLDLSGRSLTKLTFPRVTPGLPAEVLLRRPDVAEAEARLASQEFTTLQARAAFFPSITLTGQYGVQSIVLKNLFRPEAIAYSLASNLAQPLFDGYNLQGQYEFQQGRYAELAALYRKQILTALSDVENALIAVAQTEQQLRLQGEAVAAAKRALDAARATLLAGTINVITLSTVETTYFQSQDLLEQVRLLHFQAASSLYQALGGGWEPTTRDLEIARANEAYESNRGPWP
jgi:NodT family efflux transporter outer membrane factor (OMF) lipoprotein